MTRKRCSEINRCYLATCYDCRRYLIDQTAARMLEQGESPETVDRYRYPAINALTWEIPTPAPKPQAKPRKAFTPNPSRDYSAMIEKLRRCTTREQAHDMVAKGKYTIPELRHIGELAGHPKLAGRLKADVLNTLVESLVGFRLDHNAIMNAARS